MSKMKRTTLFSILQAFMISSPFLSLIMHLFLGIESGFLRACGILIFSVCVIDFFVAKTYLLSISFLKHCLFIMLFCFCTILKAYGNTALSFYDIVFYNILTYYLAIQDSSTEKVLRWIMIFSLPSAPIMGFFYKYITMGSSYAILPCIVAGILHFSYYRKQVTSFPQKLFIYFCYAVCAINIYYFIASATRGAVVACLVVLLVVLTTKNVEKKSFNLRNVIKLVVISFAIIVVANNYNSIISFMYKFVSARDIDIRAISKFYSLSLDNNISNGRIALYKEALRGFWEHPFLGNGIGVFHYDSYTKTCSYPHNFVLQFLYDGGIFLGGYAVAKILKPVFAVFFGKVQSKDAFVFMSLAICTAVIQACFSGNVWHSILFWMLPAIYEKSKIYDRRAKTLD